MSPVPPQDREHPRYAHEAVIAVALGGASYEGRTTNVSRGGMCAEFSTEIPNQSEVMCSMTLVFDEDTQSEALELAARIVWCTRVDDGWQVGIAFKPMPAERAKFLAMFLRYLDDGGSKAKAPKVERSIDDQFR